VLEPDDLLFYQGRPAPPGELANAGDTQVSSLVFGVWGAEVTGRLLNGMVEPWVEYRGGVHGEWWG
jgi:hypothetical protein